MGPQSLQSLKTVTSNNYHTPEEVGYREIVVSVKNKYQSSKPSGRKRGGKEQDSKGASTG